MGRPDVPPEPRTHLHSLLRGGTLAVVGTLARFGPGPSLRCLYAHHVRERDRQRFAALLEALQRRGRFIGSGELMECIAGAREVSGVCFHLSFDDGFKSMIDVAAPVLKDLGIPAIFFVPTSLVGVAPETSARFCREIDGPAECTELLSWDDCRQLVAAGFEIGSHTRTHARLSAVSPDRARLNDEVAGSKREIEDRLGQPCAYIAWPYGRSADADIATVRAVESAGYRGCFGAFRGAVVPGETSPFCIPRHHFEADWPASHVYAFAAGFKERHYPGLTALDAKG